MSCLLGRPVDLQNNQAVKGVFLFSTILSSKTKRCSFLFCWRQTSQSAEGVESHFTSVSRQDLNISFCNQSFYVACLTYVCRWLTGKHLLSVRSRKIQVYFFLKHVVVKTPSLPLQLQVVKKKIKKNHCPFTVLCILVAIRGLLETVISDRFLKTIITIKISRKLTVPEVCSPIIALWHILPCSLQNAVPTSPTLTSGHVRL